MTLVHAVTLAAGQANYAVPADLWQYKSTSWGAGYRGNPWDRTWPGRLPQARVIDGELWLMPAPSSHQIAMLGATFSFFYYALHVVAVDEAETTVNPGDRNLLLLRARLLSLPRGLRRISGRIGVDIVPVILNDGSQAIDVDNARTHAVVGSIIEARNRPAPSALWHVRDVA